MPHIVQYFSPCPLLQNFCDIDFLINKCYCYTCLSYTFQSISVSHPYISSDFSHCFTNTIAAFSLTDIPASVCFCSPFSAVTVISPGQEVQPGLGHSHLVFIPTQHSTGISGEQAFCTQVYIKDSKTVQQNVI